MPRDRVRNGVLVTGDIVYMYCKKSTKEELYALLASPSMRTSSRSLIQDALWSADTQGGQLQTFQPLIVRAATSNPFGSHVDMLPNGIPVSDQHLLFLQAIKDDGTDLVLSPRPSSVQEGGLLGTAWRHAPVIFTSCFNVYKRASSFTPLLNRGHRFLVTGSTFGLSTSFGALQLLLASDVSTDSTVSRLSSGFFDSDVSFVLRRFATFYCDAGADGCVRIAAREAVSTPIYCDLNGTVCRTMDGKRVHWDICECQEDNDPNDKS